MPANAESFCPIRPRSQGSESIRHREITGHFAVLSPRSFSEPSTFARTAQHSGRHPTHWTNWQSITASGEDSRPMEDRETTDESAALKARKACSGCPHANVCELGS